MNIQIKHPLLGRYADGFYDMGNRFRNEKKYQESLKAFSSAINLNPDISDYYNNNMKEGLSQPSFTFYFILL